MAIWKSRNDVKFSGDEPGVGVIVDGKALALKPGDRIYVSDAAWKRAEAKAEERSAKAA